MHHSAKGRIARRHASWLVFAVALVSSLGCSEDAAKSTKPDAQVDAGVPGNEPVERTTITQSGTVKLPAGVDAELNTLRVQSSLASVKLDASGAFTIDTYGPAAQLAIVLSPEGNPMLMGWLSAEHDTIDAQSTAEVLLWFAIGMPLLPDAVQAHVLGVISETTGLSEMADAIDASLAKDPEAFAKPNEALTAAMHELLTPFPLGDTGQVITQALVISPTDGVPQSGLAVTAAGTMPEPDDPPNTAHVVNGYRRRGWAFVERVSETDAMGKVTMDPKDITDFEVSPVIGLNAGVNGAVGNAFDAYYGNTSSAYVAVNSPRDVSTNTTLPFSVPYVSGTKTTYKVTIVGPGATVGDAFAGLTETQKLRRREVVMRGFIMDALLPFVTNALLGTQQIDWLNNLGKAGSASSGKIVAINAFKNLTQDLLDALPALMPALESGNWNDAFQTLIKDPLITNTVRGYISDFLTVVLQEGAIAAGVGTTWDKTEAVNLFKQFNTAIEAVGVGMQVFDTVKLAKEREDEHFADVWTVDASEPKVTLLPVTSLLVHGAGVELEARVPEASDLTPYKFHWTSTATSGTIKQVGGASQTGTDFCASVGTPAPATVARMLYRAGTKDGVDTVTVEVFPKGEPCPGGKALGKASVQIKVEGDAAATARHCYDFVKMNVAGKTYEAHSCVGPDLYNANGSLAAEFPGNGVLVLYWEGAWGYETVPIVPIDHRTTNVVLRNELGTFLPCGDGSDMGTITFTDPGDEGRNLGKTTGNFSAKVCDSVDEHVITFTGSFDINQRQKP